MVTDRKQYARGIKTKSLAQLEVLITSIKVEIEDVGNGPAFGREVSRVQRLDDLKIQLNAVKAEIWAKRIDSQT